MSLICKEVIRGCEARGDADSAYMTRYAFPRIGPFRICLHIFHRSDADELHDHPWPYASLILWRGYVEVTPQGRERKYPGMLLFRKATHAHRVELIDRRPAVTLVFMGTRIREWGFFTPDGWKNFVAYFLERGC